MLMPCLPVDLLLMLPLLLVEVVSLVLVVFLVVLMAMVVLVFLVVLVVLLAMALVEHRLRRLGGDGARESMRCHTPMPTQRRVNCLARSTRMERNGRDDGGELFRMETLLC
jgi:hypothetical protein